MTTAEVGRPGPARRPDRPPSGSVRPPGRPRDARADGAIIEAALHTLATTGFTGLSMEAVAARAKVGKATLYRRWSTKDTLVADALATLVETAEPVDTGSLRDDLVAWLNTVRRHNLQTLSGRIMPRLLAEKDAHPELFETYRRRVMEPFRQQAVKVLARGIATGQLPADLDVDLVTDMLIGPVAYRQYTRGYNEVSGTRVGQVVDTVLEGILARPPSRPVVEAAAGDTAGDAADGGNETAVATAGVAAPGGDAGEDVI
ncbi:TetR/AcrR family transcriptional regulator [Frankia sp. CNm7]|uniref:TetR/AcrR family transcriptional regulator n=1 Tax=Frankia nepalensis TaxID=1836974 RepID=A0A937US38_9ACTN|nr:TetR/AcrR family transcriptional regulator [Frankia nepalensis]MBL7497873.1 TetR/AcrR family transcriptional regulator [Frankia nepalensis]MBL7515183.1 TetR/AcrR family transcriptional regulator [Frankia nepalensis]MBL7518424.1 TetR/AcrR family transcriptional regulator [Frankia nepalensis]MBL7628471.1 TetR/AcrR family transcriptional regulator [Frankia nepalensis]